MAQIMFSKGDGFVWPEGTYDLLIKSVAQTVSKNNNQQLEIEVEGVDGDQAGKKFKSWWSLVPSATFRIDALVDACGVAKVETGEKDANGKPIMSFDSDELVGKIFRCTIKNRTHEGRTNNDIQEMGPSPLQTGSAAPETQNGGAPGAQAPATPPATPSTSGAPVAARRPRPAST